MDKAEEFVKNYPRQLIFPQNYVCICGWPKDGCIENDLGNPSDCAKSKMNQDLEKQARSV